MLGLSCAILLKSCCVLHLLSYASTIIKRTRSDMIQWNSKLCNLCLFDLLIRWEGLCHGVLASTWCLRLAVIKLEKVTELIVLALVNQVLTVNFTELIVMTKYFYLLRHQTFISVVMSLHYQPLYLSKILAALAWCSWGNLREDKIVVTVCKYAWNCHAFLYSDLIIMPIDCQTLHSVLLSYLESRIMII